MAAGIPGVGIFSWRSACVVFFYMQNWSFGGASESERTGFVLPNNHTFSVVVYDQWCERSGRCFYLTMEKRTTIVRKRPTKLQVFPHQTVVTSVGRYIWWNCLVIHRLRVLASWSSFLSWIDKPHDSYMSWKIWWDWIRLLVEVTMMSVR